MERVCVSNKTINYRNYASRINRRDRAKKNAVKLIAALLVFVIALVLVLIFSSNAVKTKADVNSKTKYYKSVSIQTGDSLWSIAGEYCDFTEYKDERAFIKEVKQINKLTSDNLKYGEYIIIPYFAE